MKAFSLTVSINKVKVKGRNDFQVKFISISYRIRGRVLRIQMAEKAKNRISPTSIRSLIRRSLNVEKNKTPESILMNRIFVYSAINKRANPPALYSILNPDTSSDSPSDRSKGVRLVSARVEINHRMNKGGHKIAIDKICWELISNKLNEDRKIKVLIKIRDILIS